MPVRLDTLIIDYEANYAQFDAANREAVNRARQTASQIDQLLNGGAGQRINAINQQVLKIKVDDSGLTNLNKHLDLKDQHLDRLQAKWNANPLTARVDTRPIEQAIAQVKALNTELGSLRSQGATQARVVVSYEVDGKKFADSFEKAGDKVADKISKIRLRTEGGGIIGTIFNQLTREFAKGVSDGSGLRTRGQNVGSAVTDEKFLQALEQRLAKFTQGTVYKGGPGVGLSMAFPEFSEWPQKIKKVSALLDNQINEQFKQIQSGEKTSKDLTGKARQIYAEILKDLYQQSKAAGLSPGDAAAKARSTLSSKVGGAASLSNYIAQTLTDNNWAEIRDAFSGMASQLRKATNFIHLANAYQIDDEAEALAKEYKKLIPKPTADRNVLTIFASPASDKGRAVEEFGGGIQSLFPKSNLFGPTLEAYNFTQQAKNPNFFESITQAVSRGVGSRIVAGPEAQAAGGGSAISDPLSGLLFGYSRSSRDILAARKAAIAVGYEPENVQVLGHSMGAFTARQSVAVADQLKQEFKGVGVAIGDYFKEFLPESPNYRSIYNFSDPLNAPLSLGMFAPSSTQYTAKSLPAKGLDSHAYFQSMLTPEFRKLTEEIGIKGFADADQLPNTNRELTAALAGFSKEILALRGVGIAENIAAGRKPEFGIPSPAVLVEGKKYTDVTDIHGLIEAFKSLDQQLKPYLPQNIHETAKKQGDVVLTENFGGAYQKQYDLVNQKLGAFANYLGGEGKRTLTETIKEIERLKDSARAVAISIDPAKFENDIKIPNYVPEPGPVKGNLIDQMQEVAFEFVAAERKVAHAMLELEDRMTLGLAPKYREMVSAQFEETRNVAGQYIGARVQQFDAGQNAIAVLGVLGKLAKAGYLAADNVEKFAFSLLPAGQAVRFLSKVGLQTTVLPGMAIAGATAINPALGGALAGASELAAGALAPITGAATGALDGAIAAWISQHVPELFKSGLAAPVYHFIENAIRTGIVDGADAGLAALRTVLGRDIAVDGSIIAGAAAAKQVAQQIGMERNAIAKQGIPQTIKELQQRVGYQKSSPIISEEDVRRLQIALLAAERISHALDGTKSAHALPLDKLPSDIESQMQGVLGDKSQLGKIRANALKAISGFSPAIKGAADAGDETAQGFIKALEGAMPSIQRVARGNALNYVRAIKRELGIASPSTVMIKIGQDVVAGFEIGLEDIDDVWDHLVSSINTTKLGNVSIEQINELIEQIKAKVASGVNEINIEFDRLGNFTTFADNARTVGGNASSFVSDSGEATRKELEHQLNQVPFEEIGKRAGVATAEGIGVATEAMDQLGQTVDLVLQNISPMFGAFYQQVRQQFSEIDKLGEFKGLAKSALIVGAAVVAWSMFGQQVTATLNATADAALEQNRMNRILDQLVAGGGEKYYARLADQSNRFGANLQQAAKSAASLETSLLNKTLAGQGVEILSGFQAQFAAQGTPLEDQQRALVGVEQALRRSKLQAEELYQVIEPLPGAMEALQAATGKTGAELFRATAAGEVFTEDVIQSWSNQLKAMSGLADGANTAEASMGRLQNQVYLLSANTGQLTNSIRKAGTDVLAVGLDVANKNSEALNATLLALGGSTLIGLGSALFFAGQSLVAFIAQTAVGQAALNAFMGGVTLATRAIIPLSVAIAAIGTAKLAWDMSRPRDEIQKTIDKLKQLQSEINKTAEPSTRENRFIVTPEKIKAETDKRGAIEAASLTRETIESLNKKTVAILKQGDALGRIQELYQKIAQLDAQIAINLSDGNTEAAAKKRQEVIELRRELNKKLTDTGIEDAKSRYSILQSEAKKAIDAINKQEQETGKIDKRLSEVKATQKENLELATQWADALNRAASVDFSNIAQANSLFEQRMGSIDRREAEAKIRQAQNDTAIVSQLGGLGVSNQQRLQSEQLNRKILTLQESADFLQDRINSTSDAIAQIDIDPASIGLKEALADLGARVKDATATQFDAAIKKLEAEGKSPSDDLKSLIDQAKGNKELQEQFALKAGEIEQAKVDLKKSDLEQANARIDYLRNIEQSNYDLATEIEDHNIELNRKLYETIVQTQKLTTELSKLKVRNDLESKVRTIAGDFSDQLLSSIQSIFDKINEITNEEINRATGRNEISNQVQDLIRSEYKFNRGILTKNQSLADTHADFAGVARTYTDFMKLLGPITMPESQNYGVFRKGGRQHAGQDYDISGNQNVPAGISGIVTKKDFQPGAYKYGNYIDIYNPQLKVVERIAEAATILVNVGDKIKAGQIVAKGETHTGVIHREIRTDVDAQGRGGYGFGGTIDPDKFYRTVAKQLFTEAVASVPEKYGHKQYADVSNAALVKINELHGGNYLKPEAAEAVKKLIAAAAIDGINLGVADAHRTVAEQAELFNTRAKARGSEKAAAYDTAPPGHSEHHTGYALDFGDSSGLIKGGAAADWLRKNAAKFGFEQSFKGDGPVMAEPWHFRYVASEAAKEALRLSNGGTSAAVTPPAIAQSLKSLGTMMASWYGPGFTGKQAADGSTFNENEMTVAHKTLPFGTLLKITGELGSAIAKVTDRGPFIAGRDIDLSKAVAEKVGILQSGTGPVKVEIVSGNTPVTSAEQATQGTADGAQGIIEALNQNDALNRQLSDEKIRALNLDISKDIRNTLNNIEQRGNESKVAAINLSGESAQRRFSDMPQTPLISFLTQFSSKLTEDAAKLQQSEFLVSTQARDITNLKSLSAQLGALPDDTREKFAGIKKAIDEYIPSAEKQLSILQDQIKTFKETGPLKTYEREIRIATESQLANADSMSQQIESIQALLSASGSSPISGIDRTISAQFRAARAQLDQFGAGVNATIASLNQAADDAENKGLKKLANELRAAANSLKFGAIAIRDAAQNALSPAAESIAAANARLDALFKLRQESRKFSDPLQQQLIDNADLRAQILDADNDPFGANAIKLKNQLLQKQREITDKILANELEIEKQRNLQTLEQSSPFTRTSGPRDFFGIDPGVQISSIDAVQIFPKQGSIDDVVDQVAIAKTEALAAISDALKAPAISNFDAIEGENFFTQSLDALQERLSGLDATTAIDQLGSWNDALRESLGLTEELAQRQLPTLERTIKNSFAEGGGEAVSTFFNDLWQGKDILTSLGDAFQSFANRIIQSLIDIAAQAATNWIKNLLFGAIGGGGGSGLGTSVFPAFEGGTVVGNLAGGGTAISHAVAREKAMNGGRRVGIYALTEGEEVLPVREASYYRALKANGVMDDVYAAYGVGNRANGGPIGTGHAATVAGKATQPVVYSPTYNITQEGGEDKNIDKYVAALDAHMQRSFAQFIAQQHRSRGVFS